MGDKQVIVSHIEKKEEPQEEEVTEGAQTEKMAEQVDTTTKEENPSGVKPSRLQL